MIAATRRYRARRYLNRLITATTRSKMLVQVNSLRFAGLRWLTCSPASRNSDPLHVTAGRGRPHVGPPGIEANPGIMIDPLAGRPAYQQLADLPSGTIASG